MVDIPPKWGTNMDMMVMDLVIQRNTTGFVANHIIDHLRDGNLSFASAPRNIMGS